METQTNPFLGTELKINISILPLGSLTMDDYDFSVEMYCSKKRPIIIPKDSAIRVDESNYIVRVDSNVVGAGDLKCKITAKIPDEDFADGLRTEVACFETGITITKSL